MRQNTIDILKSYGEQGIDVTPMNAIVGIENTNRADILTGVRLYGGKPMVRLMNTDTWITMDSINSHHRVLVEAAVQKTHGKASMIGRYPR